MRNLAVLFATLAIGAVAAAGSARADNTEEIELAPAAKSGFATRLFAGAVNEKKKSYACFVRRYDAAHLAQHPQQKVRDMRLLVTAETEPDAGLTYSFRLGLQFRDKRGKFDTSGDCGHVRAFEMSADKMHLGCGVDCDGGGISVEISNADKSTLIRLDEVAFWNSNGKLEEKRTRLSAGADDKVFRLDRASVEDCRSLVTDRKELAAMRHK